MNPIYHQDIVKACEKFNGFPELRGKSILITGSTGLLGSTIVDLLAESNERYGADIRIYAAGRSIERIQSRFSLGNVTPVPYDALDPLEFEVDFDYILHAAGNSYPKAIQENPVETMLMSVEGTHRLLEYGRTHNMKRFLFVSSSEVYGSGAKPPYREDVYGTTDPLLSRSSYSEGKRAGETLCASYLAEYGVDSVIVRPGHLYGPNASEKDNHVAIEFARDAAAGKPIVLKSAGLQRRSYIYIVDAAAAVLTVLLHGKKGEAYNIAHPTENLSIRELAEKYAEIGKVPFESTEPTAAEREAFNPMADSTLDATKLVELGWKPFFDTETGLRHTVEAI